jgi:signal recognition particle subunit SEC65
MGKILRKGRKIKENTGIFSATLKDIEKALEKLNQRKSPTDPKTKLP